MRSGDFSIKEALSEHSFNDSNVSVRALPFLFD